VTALQLVQIAGPTAQQAGMLTLWSDIAPMQLVPGRDRARERWIRSRKGRAVDAMCTASESLP
jgi:hypothetical protein